MKVTLTTGMTKMEYFKQNNEEVKSIAFIGTHGDYPLSPGV